MLERARDWMADNIREADIEGATVLGYLANYLHDAPVKAAAVDGEVQVSIKPMKLIERLDNYSMDWRDRAKDEKPVRDAIAGIRALLDRIASLEAALAAIRDEAEIHTKLNQERLCCKFQDIAARALAPANTGEKPS
jgi:hypothetical protein